MRFNFRFGKSTKPVTEQPELFNFEFVRKIQQGTIGKIGSFDPASNIQLRRTIQASEHVISKDLSREHAVAATPFGNMYHTIGDRNNVDIADVIPKKEREGSFVTHNHTESMTGDPFSLSNKDIEQYYKNKFSALRGAYQNQRASMHSASRPNKKLDLKFDREVARKQAMDYFKKSDYNPTEQEIEDLMMKNLSSMYGFSYWRR